MSNISVHKHAKLFYKVYPYKISYKRLYGFPSHETVGTTHFNFLKTSPAYNDWWGDIPTNDDDKQRRSNCYSFLKSIPGAKFMNSSFTHVYFKDEETFNKATLRYHDLQQSHYIPIVDNLAEIFNGHPAHTELKKTLYHKKFRYKVNIRFNQHLEEKLGPSLYDMYADNENYHLNPNMQRFAPGASNVRVSASGYSYMYRHSNYNLYAIYCRETIDMELLTFVAGENIAKISKALLIDEIDK